MQHALSWRPSNFIGTNCWVIIWVLCNIKVKGTGNRQMLKSPAGYKIESLKYALVLFLEHDDQVLKRVKGAWLAFRHRFWTNCIFPILRLKLSSHRSKGFGFIFFSEFLDQDKAKVFSKVGANLNFNHCVNLSTFDE